MLSHRLALEWHLKCVVNCDVSVIVIFGALKTAPYHKQKIYKLDWLEFSSVMRAIRVSRTPTAKSSCTINGYRKNSSSSYIRCTLADILSQNFLILYYISLFGAEASVSSTLLGIIISKVGGDCYRTDWRGIVFEVCCRLRCISYYDI